MDDGWWPGGFSGVLQGAKGEIISFCVPSLIASSVDMQFIILKTKDGHVPACLGNVVPHM